MNKPRIGYSHPAIKDANKSMTVSRNTDAVQANPVSLFKNKGLSIMNSRFYTEEGYFKEKKKQIYNFSLIYYKLLSLHVIITRNRLHHHQYQTPLYSHQEPTPPPSFHWYHKHSQGTRHHPHRQKAHL